MALRHVLFHGADPNKKTNVSNSCSYIDGAAELFCRCDVLSLAIIYYLRYTL